MKKDDLKLGVVIGLSLVVTIYVLSFVLVTIVGR